MRKYVHWMMMACLFMVSVSALGEGTNTLQRLETENRQLREDNRKLREENRKLREEIAQGQETPKTVTANHLTDNASSDSQYWITSSSKKRHNSNCKYYKNSKGFLSKEKTGVPCGVCGG